MHRNGKCYTEGVNCKHFPEGVLKYIKVELWFSYRTMQPYRTKPYRTEIKPYKFF